MGIHISPKIVETPNEPFGETFSFEIDFSIANESNIIGLNGSSLQVQFEDININLVNIITFPVNETSTIASRYDFSLECMRIPTETVISGDPTVGLEYELLLYDGETCADGLASIESGTTILTLSEEHLQVDSIYNITVEVKDTKFDYVARAYAFISVVIGPATIDVSIDVYGSKRFNSDSRVILEVSLNPDITKLGWDVDYYWFEETDQISVDMNFITAYQKYLVIDGSKDTNGDLKENAEYNLQVFVQSQLRNSLQVVVGLERF